MKNIRDLVINNYSKLTASDTYIAKKILNNEISTNFETIEEFADICTVSKSTVIRFTRKLGIDGFAELKLLLRLEENQSKQINQSFINRVCDSDIQIINYYRNYDFEPVIKILESSPRVYAFGTGMFQRSFVKEIYRLFMHLGIWVRVIEGAGEFGVALDSMKEDDTVIIISSSGENSFLKENYDLLKIKGVRIVSFTNSINNSLAYASDYNIATELTKERFHDMFYFDNIVTMYIPLKILYAKYIDYQISKIED